MCTSALYNKERWRKICKTLSGNISKHVFKQTLYKINSKGLKACPINCNSLIVLKVLTIKYYILLKLQRHVLTQSLLLYTPHLFTIT